jgi:hypothetical protein
MTQTMYAHVTKWIILKNNKINWQSYKKKVVLDNRLRERKDWCGYEKSTFWFVVGIVPGAYTQSYGCTITYSFPLHLLPFSSCLGSTSWIIIIWMMKYYYKMLCRLQRLYMRLISLGTEDACLLFPLN